MTLSARMRTAADTLEELSALYGYRHPAEQGWSAQELRAEAKHVPDNIPDYSGCSGARAALEGDE